VKDAAELKAIRRACAVTTAGHRAGAAALGPGVGEWQVEAAVEAAFRDAGATRPGFETIAGGGANACVLHYVTNGDRVPGDGMLLLDAGAEVDFYHGDVTRTLPASGRFTPRQRDVYEVVRAALVAATDTVRPGATIGDVHDAATRALVTGLVDLGVLEGPTDGLLEQAAHKPFFPHQTSHWLGLDVHDPGDYARDGVSRALEPGMVFTIEPGLYFRPGVEDDAAGVFAGLGVRIEDDVVVTTDGCEVLTADLPTTVDAVEALVGGAR
jgi:Xaa-Pro aminopeptidase